MADYRTKAGVKVTAEQLGYSTRLQLEGGTIVVGPRDWIVTGVYGERYLVREDLLSVYFELDT